MYPNILIYRHEVERMGKRAGYIVQERVADVKAQAVTYTGGAVADGNGDSASPGLCC